MIKKLAAVMLAAAMMTATVSLAAGISGTLADKSIAIVTEDKEKMILNGYDENGRLVSSNMFTAENGVFNVPSELLAYRLRASFLNGEVYDVDITEEPTKTPAPSETAEPQATETPKPTAEPSRKYPSIYEKQLDAIDAIAVIDKVSQGENSNFEPCYYVDVLYQGEETRLMIEDGVNVTSASDEFAYMNGQSVMSLKRGDAVCFTANLSGKIRKVGFVYRPLEKSIVTDGNDYGSSFEKLISNNGRIAERSDWAVMKYGGGNRTRSAIAFGVVRDKDSNSITLLGPDGDGSKSIDVDIKKDTIVYVCDMSSPKKDLSIGATGDIVKSSIPRNAEDERGIVTYSSEYTMSYALLRVVDGTATDAVIYTNYNN